MIRAVSNKIRHKSDDIRRGIARHWSPRRLPAKPHAPMLSISFDDFPKTAWTEGGAVLRQHGVHATYYLCGGLCGKFFEGIEMFDADDLQAIHAGGHEIGSHCFDHVSCLRRSQADLRCSLDDNAAFVRERLGDVRLVSFAYPYGDAPLGAKSVVQSRFSSGRGVHAELNTRTLDSAQLKAVGLEHAYRQPSELEPFIAEAASRNAWLIVYTHDVCDSPSDFGCTPEALDHVIRSAKEAGLEILPVKSAFAACAFGRE